LSWASEELAEIDLGDARLNRRAALVAERLAGAPHASIPSACNGWSETKAAYRLIAHESVTDAEVLAPHVGCTLERMRSHPVVLCLSDTTEVDFTRHPAEGLGPLSYEFQSGFLLHPVLAVTPQRLCLGVLGAQWIVRDPAKLGTGVATKKQRPLEEKESNRWPTAFDQVCAQARQMQGTRLVYVADRESDVYELLLRGQQAPADLLLRCNQDRALDDGRHLHDVASAAPAVGIVAVSVPKAAERPARTAELTLRCARVTVRPPYRKGQTLPPVTITVMRAREERPESGCEALDWILLTNRSTTTLEEAQTLLEWYVCRWQIEIYFRILKTGCGIERLQLADFSRLQVAIAIYLIVAWRIQFLLTLGRDTPGLPCDSVFEPDEWKAAWIVAKRTVPPDTPPKLQEMIRMVATLGGFMGRAGDGQPGSKTLWTGLDMVRHFVMALSAQAELLAQARPKETAKGKRRR
jgi:hypothetical protein